MNHMNSDKQKKLLVITNMYPNKKNKSFGIFVKNQVDGLKEKGMSVDVVSISDQRMGKVHVFKKYILWMIQIIYHLIVKGSKYDVVHAHYVFPSGLLGLLFKKIFGTKLILTAHGGDINRMARKNSFFFNLTKIIMEQADQIVAVGYILMYDLAKDFIIDA